MKPDEQLLREIANESTGKYIHDSNMFSSIYKNYCNMGNSKKAEEYEKILRARLSQIRLERVKNENNLYSRR